MKVTLIGLLLVCLLSFSAARVDVGTVECGDSDSWVVIPGQDPSNKLPEKESVRDVKFSKPYGGVPKVFAGPSSIDSNKDYNLRYNIYVKSVTKDGFRITCTTWWDTKIYNLKVNWISISGTS